MRVLIIGGTGLISTAITRCLIARGDAVTLYNRGQTDADIPEGYNIIIGNRKDYGTFEAQMAVYGEIIERWKHLSTKEAFFNASDNTET